MPPSPAVFPFSGDQGVHWHGVPLRRPRPFGGPCEWVCLPEPPADPSAGPLQQCLPEGETHAAKPHLPEPLHREFHRAPLRPHLRYERLQCPRQDHGTHQCQQCESPRSLVGGCPLFRGEVPLFGGEVVLYFFFRGEAVLYLEIVLYLEVVIPYLEVVLYLEHPKVTTMESRIKDTPNKGQPDTFRILKSNFKPESRQWHSLCRDTRVRLQSPVE